MGTDSLAMNDVFLRRDVLYVPKSKAASPWTIVGLLRAFHVLFHVVFFMLECFVTGFDDVSWNSWLPEPGNLLLLIVDVYAAQYVTSDVKTYYISS